MINSCQNKHYLQGTVMAILALLLTTLCCAAENQTTLFLFLPAFIGGIADPPGIGSPPARNSQYKLLAFNDL